MSTRPRVTHLVVVAALGLALTQFAHGHADSERDKAREDARALIRAFRVAADGGGGSAACRLFTTAALRRVGGLTKCSQTLTRGMDAKFRAHLRSLRIVRVVMSTGRGFLAANVLLAPVINGDYWQWVLRKERGRYRLDQEIG